MATYPYNFFKTDKNLSLEQISSIASIPRLNVSILKNYEVIINDFIRGPKKNMPSAMIQKKIDELKKFKTLELISQLIFNNFLINNKNIFLFSKEIILVKYRLREYINSIKEFLKLKDQKLFSSYLIHTYKDNLSYKNPITFANINELDRTYIIDKIYVDYNKNKKKLQKLLDILFHGDYINLSLPSMGAMSSYIEDITVPSTKNFVNFIYNLLSYFSKLDSLGNNNSKFISELPITELEISKIIARKLVNENNMNNKLSLPDNFSLSTSNTNFDIVKLIENNISGINVKLKELMFDVKTKKIKPEFLIPYKIDKDKIDPTKEIITELKKSETSSKLKNLKETMKHNFDIFYYVANKVFNAPDGIKSMNEPNYKNVLACLLFIIINIVYEFQKEYIKNVNNILIDLTQTSNKKFGKLNIENGFEFIELLNKSLYKFKLVLFNNFYHLFTPGKIQNTIYGMKKNEAGCYKPDARFLSDNQYILDNYPFNDTTKTISVPGTSSTPEVYTIDFIISKINQDRLAKFLTTIKSKYDIYDKNDTVELGGFAFGQDITMEGFNMITNFYKLYYENCNFSIFTIDLLFKNFTDDKKIIIELFSDIISNIPDMRRISYLPKEEKDRFEYLLTKEYSDALTNATKLLVKLNSIVQKIKLNKKTNNNNNAEYSGNNTLFKEREILKISSTLYYFKSIGIDTICKNYVSDVKLKNKLITKFGEIKKENEKILEQYK